MAPHVHPGRGNGRAHLRRHRRRVWHQRRVGGQGADREGAQDARARARPRCEASRLSDRDDGELAVRRPQPAAARRPREAGEAEPHRLHHAPGVGALVRQRRRESLLRGQAVRLDARLPRRRALAALGTAVLPLQRPRLRGQRPRRRRRRLARPLRGHGAVVRLRRALRRHQRQPRRPAATARRPVPAADGDELPRAAGEGSHRQGVRRPSDDHRPRGESDAAAQRPRRLPVPEPLHSRLPVRRLLQQQRLHAAGRLRDGQADAPAVLDRDRAHLRRQHQPGHRRPHRRRGDEPDDGVLRARHLPLCVGDRVDVHPAQLDFGSVPERPRQRQRRARPQPDGPPLQGRGQRPVRGFRRPVLQGAAPERHLHPAVPESRREVAAEGLHPRASATRAARAARTGRAASRS